MAAPRCQRRLYTDLDLSDRDRKRFRYLAGRLGQRRGREPLNRMPHKDVYLIDISLAIGYAFDEVSGWRDWVHGHLLRGKKCYLLPEVAKAFARSYPGHALPHTFEVLRLSDDIMQTHRSQLDTVFSEIASALDLKGRTVDVMRPKMDLFIEAFLFARSCDPAQIDPADFESGLVVFASHSYKTITKMVGNVFKARTVERILRRHGVARMLPVRLVDNNAMWADVPREYFESVPPAPARRLLDI
ncbi:hypothetical protein PBRA_001947 [Plasmodiophora brassicae]|nr:hypothetical protein PBRA_001947 [Plasmodiophora brassicae]